MNDDSQGQPGDIGAEYLEQLPPVDVLLTEALQTLRAAHMGRYGRQGQSRASAANTMVNYCQWHIERTDDAKSDSEKPLGKVLLLDPARAAAELAKRLGATRE